VILQGKWIPLYKKQGYNNKKSGQKSNYSSGKKQRQPANG
jgi:hypothetical protein